ncbi:MAG: peptide chain release factor 1 [Euryarchaeota archaeon]|nr:peptide chain release factor 1 [Euryarchaeota archaeon]
MSTETALARYEFKRKLDEVRSVKGRATELISLYVPPERQIFDVTNYLRNEYAQSSNIKSRTTKKNVMWAIESLIGRLKNYKAPPPNGVVFFVGHKSGSGDQSVPVTMVIEPPEPFTTFMYRCDSFFYTEILDDMLAEKDTYGLIVIDRQEATLGYVRGRRIVPIKTMESHVMGKHSRGGQSALRFERLIENAAHEYFKKVADLATESFLGDKTVRGIIIGGPGPTKDFFLKEGYLHHELEKKVIDTFDTGYTDEYGLKELVKNASKALENLDIIKEKNLMERFFEELRKGDESLAVYGEAEVLKALEIGAVETLLVSEGIDALRESKGIGTVADKSYVQTLSEMAAGYGTKVELVSTESEEGDMLIKAFNGLVAILRYRMR